MGAGLAVALDRVPERGDDVGDGAVQGRRRRSWRPPSRIVRRGWTITGPPPRRPWPHGSKQVAAWPGRGRRPPPAAVPWRRPRDRGRPPTLTVTATALSSAATGSAETPGGANRHPLGEAALPPAGAEPFQPGAGAGRARARHQDAPRPQLLPRPDLPAGHPPPPRSGGIPQQPRPGHLPRPARPAAPALSSRSGEPAGRPRPHGQRDRALADRVHPGRP